MTTILFDVDGTLLFFRGLGRQAMELAMREVWGLADPLRGVSFAGATDSGIARQVGDGRPREPMWSRYLQHLRRLLGEGDCHETLPGVVDLLDELASRGARLGLLTGNMREGALTKLRAAGLETRFDYSCSAFAEDGLGRNELAEEARVRCGSGPLAIVGDSVADIRCARHIGVPVLSVSTGPQPAELLRAEAPDLLVDDLTATDELSGWLLAPR